MLGRWDGDRFLSGICLANLNISIRNSNFRLISAGSKLSIILVSKKLLPYLLDLNRINTIKSWKFYFRSKQRKRNVIYRNLKFTCEFYYFSLKRRKRKSWRVNFTTKSNFHEEYVSKCFIFFIPLNPRDATRRMILCVNPRPKRTASADVCHHCWAPRSTPIFPHLLQCNLLSPKHAMWIILAATASIVPARISFPASEGWGVVSVIILVFPSRYCTRPHSRITNSTPLPNPS